ncbi:hypothetical protein [Brucella sp. NBRC 12950]|uniref:hypothetical protein n=1 Tax=Brucella sp. NBRC 12950 TaxID=2994518 RepID=UPI0024A43154|nr:hypothetical protein [Brucella sp. NBRC 12950]GLU27395.1 hypothetical protein Brsp01_26280 [Brucella sp. NBRC 12950]
MPRESPGSHLNFWYEGVRYRLIVHVAYPYKRVLVKLTGNHNDDDLARALAEVSRYFDDPPDSLSDDGVRFDILSHRIEA